MMSSKHFVGRGIFLGYRQKGKVKVTRLAVSV